MPKPEQFYQFLGTCKNAPDQRPDQQPVYHMGVWALPKLLAEAKSDDSERTTPESFRSKTPWAHRPSEYMIGTA